MKPGPVTRVGLFAFRRTSGGSVMVGIKRFLKAGLAWLCGRAKVEVEAAEVMSAEAARDLGANCHLLHARTGTAAAFVAPPRRNLTPSASANMWRTTPPPMPSRPSRQSSSAAGSRPASSPPVSIAPASSMDDGMSMLPAAMLLSTYACDGAAADERSFGLRAEPVGGGGTFDGGGASASWDSGSDAGGGASD